MAFALEKMIKSARLYHWPIILLNTYAMAHVVKFPSLPSIIIGIAVSCAASYGFIINDLCDIKADTANNVERLQDLNKKGRDLAKIVCLTLFVISVWVSLIVGIKTFFLNLIVLTGLTVYSVFIRQTVYANFLCALICTSPLWIIYVLGNVQSLPLIFVMISAFSLILNRELVLDMQDLEGDKIGGRKSMPVVFGIHRSKQIGFGYLFLGIASLVASLVFATMENKVIASVVACIFSLLFLVPYVRLCIKESKFAHATFNKYTRYAMLFLPILLLIYQ